MICTSVIIVGKNDNAESERKIVLALFWLYTQGLAISKLFKMESWNFKRLWILGW